MGRIWRFLNKETNILWGHQSSKNWAVPTSAWKRQVFWVCTISSLSPKLRFLARSDPPFVIRGIQWKRSGLQMADQNERKNGVWGREKGNRANTEDVLQLLGALKIRFLKNAQKTQDLISHFGALDYAEISNFRCPTRDKNDEWIIPTKVAWIQNLFQKSNINS